MILLERLHQLGGCVHRPIAVWRMEYQDVEEPLSYPPPPPRRSRHRSSYQHRHHRHHRNHRHQQEHRREGGSFVRKQEDQTQGEKQDGERKKSLEKNAKEEITFPAQQKQGGEGEKKTEGKGEREEEEESEERRTSKENDDRRGSQNQKTNEENAGKDKEEKKFLPSKSSSLSEKDNEGVERPAVSSFLPSEPSDPSGKSLERKREDEEEEKKKRKEETTHVEAQDDDDNASIHSGRRPLKFMTCNEGLGEPEERERDRERRRKEKGKGRFYFQKRESTERGGYLNEIDQDEDDEIDKEGYPVSIHLTRLMDNLGADDPIFLTVKCRYVVGCDGMKSMIRKASSISFNGMYEKHRGRKILRHSI
ncbi:fad binding domain-containing protein [Cystoisospora suis]|uniref:Fad binding domain-containing protein n=1 Tax=Cystoisospora suis TaxID=483139 RepID=A0A2C6L2E1_9APIC|nr:fad binding domain-containing protein [Cystoisospora suis]